MTAASPSRQELRREFRARRRAIPSAERAAAARAVAGTLIGAKLIGAGRRIGIYLAHDGELDPGPIGRAALALGAKLYLPVVTRAASGRMRFAPLDSPYRAWRANRYGILEPGALPHLYRSAGQLDLVLLPLVAFDAAGHRLGMGGGFYDRALQLRRRRTQWRRPLLVGLAFDCQEAASLSSASWDVPLDYVATPTRLIRASATPPEVR